MKCNTQRHLDMTGFPGIMTTENVTFRAEVLFQRGKVFLYAGSKSEQFCHCKGNFLKLLRPASIASFPLASVAPMHVPLHRP